MAFVGLAVVFVEPDPTPAAAVDNCGKVIPLPALAGTTAISLATLPKAVVTLVGTETVVGTAAGVGAGGASAAAGIGVGGVALAAAAGLSAFVGTCKFLDWVTGAPLSIPVSQTTPTGAVTGFVTDPPVSCSSYSLPTLANGQCVHISWVSGYDWGGFNYNSYLAPAGFAQPPCPTSAGVSLACHEFSAMFGGFAQPTLQVLNGPRNGWCGQVGLFTAGACGETRYNSINKDTWIGISCAGNIGGVCGLHPKKLVALEYPCSNCGWSAVFNPITARSRVAWNRYIHTEVNCQGSSWATANSAVFNDLGVAERIPMPICPVGKIPLRIRAWLLPTGIECGVVNGLCPNGQGYEVEMYGWDAPAAWGSTGLSAPAWATCLSSGSTCGTPGVVNGTCVWGGAAVAAGFCDPGQHAGTSTTAFPTTAPVAAAQPVAALAPAPGARGSTVDVAQPSPTTTAPPAGNAVTVPIDPDGETSARPRTGPEADGCWPGGWGWFNPLSWVLQPIKCAFQWAFVPPSGTLATKLALFDGFRDQPPIQWVDEGASWVAASVVTFAPWSTAGPGCTEVLGTPVCPRDWDTSAVPAWVGNALLVGLWFVVVLGVWRFF